MTEPCSLGTNIAQLRRDAKLTQAALADRIGVTGQAISQWERGETMPDILTLPILAEVFSCSIDALFHAKKQKSPLSPNAWRVVLMHGDQVVEQKDIPARITKNISLEINGAVAGDVYSDLPVIIHGAVSGNLHGNGVITIEHTETDTGKKHVHISVANKNKPTLITLPEELDEDYEAVLMRNGKIVETAKLPGIGDRVELHINGNAGDVQSAFSVTVEGDVEGDVTCTEARIEGSVEGDVSANTVTVYGDVDGDIDADTVLRG